jgi:hypothetical protein
MGLQVKTGIPFPPAFKYCFVIAIALVKTSEELVVLSTKILMRRLANNIYR